MLQARAPTTCTELLLTPLVSLIGGCSLLFIGLLILLVCNVLTPIQSTFGLAIGPIIMSAGVLLLCHLLYCHIRQLVHEQPTRPIRKKANTVTFKTISSQKKAVCKHSASSDVPTATPLPSIVDTNVLLQSSITHQVFHPISALSEDADPTSWVHRSSNGHNPSSAGRKTSNRTSTIGSRHSSNNNTLPVKIHHHHHHSNGISTTIDALSNNNNIRPTIPPHGHRRPPPLPIHPFTRPDRSHSDVGEATSPGYYQPRSGGGPILLRPQVSNNFPIPTSQASLNWGRAHSVMTPMSDNASFQSSKVGSPVFFPVMSSSTLDSQSTDGFPSVFSLPADPTCGAQGDTPLWFGRMATGDKRKSGGRSNRRHVTDSETLNPRTRARFSASDSKLLQPTELPDKHCK